MPAFIGWKPSTSFSNGTASRISCSRIPLRQRQLHEDAVDAVVGGELADEREQLVVRDRRRQAVHLARHADLLRRALLVAHVHGGRRVFAREHDVQRRRTAVRLRETRDLGRDLATDLRGDRLAIQDACGLGHAPLPSRCARRPQADRSEGVNKLPAAA
jgi:hypothetical protein